MRILVIDDEDMIRCLIRTILTDAGHEVVGAADGREGIRHISRERFDLIICDILMPEKEGNETIFEIRKLQSLTPILAISGGGRTQNLKPLELSRNLGANMILPKPFEPQELIGAVELITTHAKGRRAIHPSN